MDFKIEERMAGFILCKELLSLIIELYSVIVESICGNAATVYDSYCMWFWCMIGKLNIISGTKHNL